MKTEGKKEVWKEGNMEGGREEGEEVTVRLHPCWHPLSTREAALPPAGLTVCLDGTPLMAQGASALLAMVWA